MRSFKSQKSSTISKLTAADIGPAMSRIEELEFSISKDLSERSGSAENVTGFNASTEFVALNEGNSSNDEIILVEHSMMSSSSSSDDGFGFLDTIYNKDLYALEDESIIRKSPATKKRLGQQRKSIKKVGGILSFPSVKSTASGKYAVIEDTPNDVNQLQTKGKIDPQFEAAKAELKVVSDNFDKGNSWSSSSSDGDDIPLNLSFHKLFEEDDFRRSRSTKSSKSLFNQKTQSKSINSAMSSIRVDDDLSMESIYSESGNNALDDFFSQKNPRYKKKHRIKQG